MKTIYHDSAKCLGFLLFLLAFSLTASAFEQSEWVVRNGLVFELVYDQDSGGGEAILLQAMPDEHIEYGGEWGPDSTLILPSMVGGEFDAYPLTTIMEYAFSGCKDLKDVIIPCSVTRIGDYAFFNSSVETVSFDLVEYPPVSIGEGAFMKCERLKSFTMNQPLKDVSNYMFMSCPNLTSVYIYYNSYADMDTIGACAFANCVNLKYLYIPNSITTIRKGAFANCYSLPRIDLPGGITTIERYAFAECHALQNVVFYDSMTEIGEGAFLNCQTMTTVVLPNQLTEVKPFTFYGCSGLTNLYTQNATTIGQRAFGGCNKLTEVDLSKVSDIGEGAFLGGQVFCELWNSTNLADTTWLDICIRSEHNSVNLGSLRDITLGEAMTEINDLTFAGHIPSTITCMAPAPPVYTRSDNYDLVFSNAAYNTSVLRVPQVLVSAYQNAYGWKRFTNIEGITIMGNGDANGDGEVSVLDVTTLIDALLGSSIDKFNAINADANGDGSISVADVTTLIDKLLGTE